MLLCVSRVSLSQNQFWISFSIIRHVTALPDGRRRIVQGIVVPIKPGADPASDSRILVVLEVKLHCTFLNQIEKILLRKPCQQRS